MNVALEVVLKLSGGSEHVISATNGDNKLHLNHYLPVTGLVRSA